MSDRLQWFTHDRFGMFIHFGLYSIPARGEWIRMEEHIPPEQYHQYFNEFNPVDYDPRKWARAAKEAGMKYAVMTAKHHDGFCLFDSALTHFKSTNTPCGRDLVREYLEAFRAEGLKAGLYFSILDWEHPDYPHYGHRIHPMNNNEEYKDKTHDFDRYLDFMHAQVREICTNYGKLDLLWFDFSYDDMHGEKWRATELVKMVRSLQPDVIIDNRLEVNDLGNNSMLTDNPLPYSGDYVSPEQFIPPNGIRKLNGDPLPWELCLTMNNHWGFAQFDKDFLAPETIVRKLAECVSKGGNMLLNVGPDARGNIPPQALEVLKSVGEWMRLNSESIYGCGYSPLPKPEYGRITASADGKKIYVHVIEQPIGPVPVAGIKKEAIKRVRLLSTGSELLFSRSWTVKYYPEYVFIELSGQHGAPSYTLPDPKDTVIMIELND